MEGLAEITAAHGQPRRAARLLGAVEALRAAPLAARMLYLQAPADRAAAVAREAMGQDAFDAARAEGATLSLEQAVAEALKEGTPAAAR
jgi:hypothetical protein